VKRICVVTGTRAEYGLLRPVIQRIQVSASLDLAIVATGMHLSPEFGLTYREIEADGFPISRKVEMLLSSDTPVGIAKSMGLALVGMADAISDLSPDMILVLGDRYEIFSAVAAAMVARIPVVHLHGGEATEGLIDESIRHSITKMSHLHFVAAEEYRRRVIQLGESPDRVYCVGGLGTDSIVQLELLSQSELESALDFRLGAKSVLVTFHPVTLEQSSAGAQMRELLDALDALPDTNIVFTMPNADTDGRVLVDMIEEYVRRRPEMTKAFTSLGQLRYLSCLQYVDVVVGNSSSGLLEVPSFRKPTVNIGDRQRGRIKAASVIDCEPHRASIQAAIDKALSVEFRTSLASVQNPYGSGGASEKIVRILETIEFDGLLKKRFCDIVDK
jgi:GDP/UDP-N,N'-diacetylbacillosamine 2-epimerase (hydrolysing)